MSFLAGIMIFIFILLRRRGWKYETNIQVQTRISSSPIIRD